MRFLSQAQDTTKCLRRLLEKKGEKKLRLNGWLLEELLLDRRRRRRTRKLNVVEGVLLGAKRGNIRE